MQLYDFSCSYVKRSPAILLSPVPDEHMYKGLRLATREVLLIFLLLLPVLPFPHKMTVNCVINYSITCLLTLTI